jgi:hypothetical protein
MCGRRNGKRRVGPRNWCAAASRTIENKNGVLRDKETERRIQEGYREIRLACRSVAGNDAREQG